VAFADPQTVTVNAVAQTLARVAQNGSAGSFLSNDGNFRLDISHQYTKANRVRSSVKFSTRKIAADPLISAQNIQFSESITVVVDRPATGYTVAQTKLDVDGFLTWLTASSGAKMTQLLGTEN
jgi:hypothetical protein